jgi:hypothetical protein
MTGYRIKQTVLMVIGLIIGLYSVDILIANSIDEPIERQIWAQKHPGEEPSVENAKKHANPSGLYGAYFVCGGLGLIAGNILAAVTGGKNDRAA